MNVLLEITVFTLSLLCIVIPLAFLYYRYRKGGHLSLAEPIWILILFISIGVNVKTFYIQFIQPVDAVAVFQQYSDRMLQGGGLEVLLPGLVGILLGTTFFVVGYALCNRGLTLPIKIQKYSFDKLRFFIAVVALLSLAIFSFIAFISYEYFFVENANASLKRFNDIEGGSVNRLFTFKYYLYKFSTVGKYVFYLVFIYILIKKNVSVSIMILLFLLFAFITFISAYFGNRANTLLSIFEIFIIYSFNFSRKNMLYLVIFTIIAFSTMLLTTTIRYGFYESGVSSLKVGDNSELSPYYQCRERVDSWDSYIAKQLEDGSGYWGNRANELDIIGTGETSLPVKIIDQIFPLQVGRDICFGNNDIVTNLDISKPPSSLYYNLLGKLDFFLQGRYFTDVLKTTYIIRKVPQDINYLYGQSLIGWMFAPIPSSIWSSKPIFMEVPPILATVIFNEFKNNVPPGIIGELFLNFGWFGIIIGMLIIGYFLRFIYNVMRENQNIIIVQVIYAMLMVRMTVILFNSSFGTAMLKSLIDIVPLLILLWLVAVKTKVNK